MVGDTIANLISHSNYFVTGAFNTSFMTYTSLLLQANLIPGPNLQVL